MNPIARPQSRTARWAENVNAKSARAGGQERSPLLPRAACELRATEMGQRELASPPDSLSW